MNTISDAHAVILTIVIFALIMALVFLYSTYRHLRTNHRVLKEKHEELQARYDEFLKKN